MASWSSLGGPLHAHGKAEEGAVEDADDADQQDDDGTVARQKRPPHVFAEWFCNIRTHIHTPTLFQQIRRADKQNHSICRERQSSQAACKRRAID